MPDNTEKKEEISLYALIGRIAGADDDEISQIIQEVIRRYGQVYPDWEVAFVALPKDPQKRAERAAALLEFIQGKGI